MQQVIDTVVTSSDLSLDRVQKAGLPIVLVFHEDASAPEWRASMDQLAARYAGRALIVMLRRNDAREAASRYGIAQYPAVVTLRDGKLVTVQQGVADASVRAHVAYLLGEGPRPAEHTARPAQGPAAGRPVAVNVADFEREVLRSDRPVLVDFWAPWCGPCRMVEPTVEALARDESDGLKVAKVNVDENPGLAARYGAMSIPTMLVIVRGREVDRWVGAMPGNALRDRVRRWVQSQPQAA